MKLLEFKKEYSGVLALVLLAFIYGFVGILARELAPGLTMLQQLYIRYIPATVILYLVFHKHIKIQNCVEMVKKQPLLVMLRSACLFIVAIPLYFYAVQNAPLGAVGLLQILPYTFVLGVIINREKLNFMKVALMFLALLGALLITAKSGLSFTSFGRGELASIASGALLSLGFVTRKQHKTKANDYEISFVLILIGGIVIFTSSVLLGQGVPHPTQVNGLWIAAWLVAVLLNSFMILLSNHGFRHVKDTLANNIMTLEGAFAIVAGLVIYKEIPTSKEWLGALVIFSAAVGSAYVGREIKSNPNAEMVT